MQQLNLQARQWLRSPLPELLFWTAALVMLALSDVSGTHFSLCPLALAGMEWCPGCGLGRSIHLAFHGQWLQSFYMHPLGFFAIGVITFRIYKLFSNLKNYCYES